MSQRGTASLCSRPCRMLISLHEMGCELDGNSNLAQRGRREPVQAQMKLTHRNGRTDIIKETAGSALNFTPKKPRMPKISTTVTSIVQVTKIAATGTQVL